MPDLIDRHKLATKTDFVEVDKRFDTFDRDLDQLENWRTETRPKVDDLKKRMKRLELKYGG
jgi:polyhydroxyalkanoate synthesis regulator phasin